MSTHVISGGSDGRGIQVEVEPELGGRIGQICVGDTQLLVGRSAEHAAAVAWGAYPMVPWAGRIRHGEFDFRGAHYRLPINHGGHAMHGVGMVSEWTVSELQADRIALTLALPEDDRWPFGGAVRQEFVVDADGVSLEMRVEATDQALPFSFGWHPWFRKPAYLDVHPEAMYRRDAEGVAVDELVPVSEHPWDDCFVIRRPITLVIDDVRLELRSAAEHWVIYDEPDHATCIEPQTGPPDAFTIAQRVLEPGGATEIRLRIDVL